MTFNNFFFVVLQRLKVFVMGYLQIRSCWQLGQSHSKSESMTAKEIFLLCIYAVLIYINFGRHESWLLYVSYILRSARLRFRTTRIPNDIACALDTRICFTGIRVTLSCIINKPKHSVSELFMYRTDFLFGKRDGP